ncbi:extracellular solute-binding protein [Paenibacillus sp. FSL H8-0034]|uniref:extracellular solute-binding protein n=1 Tax=Paenibacillus sp. FSL H8-0034 TaxID=2954671 RepID=UPI0030F681FA
MNKQLQLLKAPLAGTLILGLLSACAQSPAQPAGQAAQTNAEPTKYPIQTKETLSYWIEMNASFLGLKSTLKDVPFFQDWQKNTGVTLNITEIPNGQSKEAFNLMLASGDLPDVVEYNWLTGAPGGPEKMINDGYILKLNDLIDKHAPNLKKYLKDNPDVDKMVKTDSGSYYVFPFIRKDDLVKTTEGPVIRKDWLDELGLQTPTTIDEWHDVLKAFKEKKGVAAPLSIKGKPRALESLINGSFVGAYGVVKNFYVDNGQVKYGPAEPGYKEFLTTMHQWYEEGLLDKNFTTADTKSLDAAVTSGATGATIGGAGGGIGKWGPILTAKEPNANLVPAPYPVLKKGDTPKFGQKEFSYSGASSAAISAKAKNPELAVKFLDYAYSEEGYNFFNFGTAGLSYNLENGYPKYTDLLLKNPDKLAPSQAMGLYIRAAGTGPFIQDKRFIEQFYAMPQQKDALTVWKSDNDKYALPPVTISLADSGEYSKIMSDVNTLVDETSLKIILGTLPVDSFDSHLAKLKSVNLDKAIQITQKAYDQYNKR